MPQPDSRRFRAGLMTALVIAIAAMTYSVSHATVLHYQATLNGPNESPPNLSPAGGLAEVTIDNVANTMRVQVVFSGLTGTTTASHIHAPTVVAGTGTASVATTTPTFTGFPTGVTAGNYDHTFDLTLATSYNGAFVTASGGTVALAEAALLAAIAAGKAYLNIHSSTFGGGEIRGFFTTFDPVPTNASTWGRIKQLYR